MTSILSLRGLIYLIVGSVLVYSSLQTIFSLADHRQTISQLALPNTDFDIPHTELALSRLQESLGFYVFGYGEMAHDEVTTRFDILWSRARLFIDAPDYQHARDTAQADKVAATLIETLQRIEDDVFELERGDVETLRRVQASLAPFVQKLAANSFAVEERTGIALDTISTKLRDSVGKLDKLTITASIATVVLLSLIAFEAIQARRAERRLADYQEHLEDLVDQRTQELSAQALKLEKALEREKELNILQRRFVSMVSHEFRTPLAIMDGAAQRLKRKFDRLPKEKVLAAAEQVERSVRRLINLIESVLSASQLQAGAIALNIDHCDISVLLEDVCNDQLGLAKQHSLDLDIEALNMPIKADEKLIRQVFSNLLSNAVKYSPEGGTVWVRGWESNGKVMISVRDEGVGIPANELPRLFEQFFRASTSTGIPGTGIGLNFVSHLIAMHEGLIDVETDEGEGSTFTVSLPIDGPKCDMVQQAA